MYISEERNITATSQEVLNTPQPNIYYVITDKQAKPIITIVLAKKENSNIYIRGIAICSKDDHININLGQTKALGRARKALKQNKSTLPINRDEAIRTLFEVKSTPFHYKSEFNIKLTPFEKELLGV